MAKRMTIVILLLLVVFGGIFGWIGIRDYYTKKFFATYQPPPAVISAAKAQTQNWTAYLTSVGTLRAINNVSITSEANGMVLNIYFISGQFVKQGESLIQLDDRPDQQDLKNFQAQIALDKINYQRQLALYPMHYTSQQELDTATSKMKQTEAMLNKTKVLIDQKNIKAPFTGKLGITTLNVGQYVSAGDKLVTLQSFDPIYVDFALPEQNFPLLHMGQPVTLTIDAYPNLTFSGIISAIDSQVDKQTHNISVQATITNHQLHLYPGMFANVKVILPQKNNVIVVPQTAVTFSLYGSTVYVIKQQSTDKNGKPILRVYQQTVTTGDQLNNQIIVTKGLQAGEEVVTSGQLKLDNGTRVEIDNSINMNKVIPNAQLY